MPEPLSALLMVGFFSVPVAPARPTAVSREGRAVIEATLHVQDRLYVSQALSGATQRILMDARNLQEAHGTAGWDGDDAQPITPATLRHVSDFLRALPSGVPLPELSAEPDGMVAVEWLFSPHRMLSVSVGASSTLAYAWLNGSERGHATARFDGVTLPVRMRQTLDALQ